RVSMLRRLAIITVIVTISAALLDYLFKAVVTADVRQPDDLARLFALFHGVVGISTAVVQWTLGRRALQRWGLARTLATLPGAVIVFGAAALAAPGLGSFVALRGAENVLRNSLYRDAYEVFYTPLLVHERRATKTVIDVGVERLGDVLGGLLVLALLAMTQPATTLLLVCAVGLSALGVLVALEAQRSYVQALERSLTASAIELEIRATVARALALPADPVRSAFHNLWSSDHALRGVALEYLENVLPGDLRDRLWRALGIEAPRPGARKRPIEDVLAELRSRCARSGEPRPLELPPSGAIAALE
ncbi:MAG: hypothetical protein ACTHU0_02410, partial [Kofleriaceae bacterium]